MVGFDGGLRGRQEAVPSRDDPSEAMSVEARILKRKRGCVDDYRLVDDYDDGDKRESEWEPLLRGLYFIYVPPRSRSECLEHGVSLVMKYERRKSRVRVMFIIR